MKEEERVEFEDVECLAETDRAILCRCEAWDMAKVWIPKSQVGPYGVVFNKGDTGVLMVSAWFAKKENL